MDEKPAEYAFLPWLFLADDHVVGRFSVLRVGRPGGPYDRVRPVQLAKEQYQTQILDRLSSYIAFNGDNRDGWTIVGVDEKITFPTSDALERQKLRLEIRDACELLAFSSIVCNELFRPFDHYANSSVFQPIFQEVKAGPGYTAFIQNRKWSAVSHGWPSETRLPEPLHCHSLGTSAVDAELLQALTMLTSSSSPNSRLGLRLKRAVHVFLRGYTDVPSNRIEDEVIFQVAALEALFGSEGKLTTADNLEEILASDLCSQPFSDSPRFADDKLHGKSDPSRSTFWNWFIELYDLRNKYHHCEEHNPERDVWSPTEHNIMSVHVFVLAVRYLLAKEGYLEPSTRTRAQVEAFVPILGEHDWGGGREPGTLTAVTWERITNDIHLNLALENIAAEGSDE